jgi:hypothetical protein
MAVRPAQARVAQAGDEFPSGDGNGSEGDGGIADLGRQVVVVALEAAPRDPEGRGDLMELVVRRVTHQVTPQAAAMRPDGGIDQDGHAPILP